jgi:hypothetical protein
VEELKVTKISSSSLLINEHIHAVNSSKPCPVGEEREERGRGERRERERREKRKGEIIMDFNAFLIHFIPCF